jgi:hypothetical protein
MLTLSKLRELKKVFNQSNNLKYDAILALNTKYWGFIEERNISGRYEFIATAPIYNTRDEAIRAVEDIAKRVGSADDMQLETILGDIRSKEKQLCNENKPLIQCSYSFRKKERFQVIIPLRRYVCMGLKFLIPSFKMKVNFNFN